MGRIDGDAIRDRLALGEDLRAGAVQVGPPDGGTRAVDPVHVAGVDRDTLGAGLAGDDGLRIALDTQARVDAQLRRCDARNMTVRINN